MPKKKKKKKIVCQILWLEMQQRNENLVSITRISAGLSFYIKTKRFNQGLRQGELDCANIYPGVSLLIYIFGAILFVTTN